MQNLNPHDNQYMPYIFSAARKFYGYNQTDFAKLLECSQATISKVESASLGVDLGLWFHLIRKCKLLDPYCFMYGGIEIHPESFEILKFKQSNLAPSFDFEHSSWISSIKKIRPIFDFIKLKDKKTLKKFLEENKVKEEIFYILNHPLTDEFIAKFFDVFKSSKTNGQSMALLDLSFNSALGFGIEAIKEENFQSEGLSILSKIHNDPFQYVASNNVNEYLVQLDEKSLRDLGQSSKSELFINYNILFPFHVYKSLSVTKDTKPIITSTKESQEWKVSYVV